MSLERFRRTRMIVLTSGATACQAARAMADNRIGSIRVSDAGSITGMVTDRDLALAALGGGLDPNATTLGAVMSEDVVTCEIDTALDEAVRMMRDAGIRRIPITEGGRLSGLIAFDDLVVDGSVDLEALKSIVTAQLEVEAPQKPAGALYPQAPARAEHRTAGRARALVGAQARAEATHTRLVTAIASAAALDRGRAERAFLIATCMLCRRLMPQEAQDLIAQLPSKVRPQLGQCVDGPNRAVTVEAIRKELARARPRFGTREPSGAIGFRGNRRYSRTRTDSQSTRPVAGGREGFVRLTWFMRPRTRDLMSIFRSSGDMASPPGRHRIAGILAARYEACRLPIGLCHISDRIHSGRRPSLTGKYLPSRSFPAS